MIRDYNERCYWFELADWLRKVMLSGLLLFFDRGPFNQLFLGTVLSISFLCLQHVLQPYKLRWHNGLKVIVELALCLTFLVSFQIRVQGAKGTFPAFDFVLLGSFAMIAVAMPLS